MSFRRCVSIAIPASQNGKTYDVIVSNNGFRVIKKYNKRGKKNQIIVRVFTKLDNPVVKVKSQEKKEKKKRKTIRLVRHACPFHELINGMEKLKVSTKRKIDEIIAGPSSKRFKSSST